MNDSTNTSESTRFPLVLEGRQKREKFANAYTYLLEFDASAKEAAANHDFSNIVTKNIAYLGFVYPDLTKEINRIVNLMKSSKFVESEYQEKLKPTLKILLSRLPDRIPELKMNEFGNNNELLMKLQELSQNLPILKKLFPVFLDEYMFVYRPKNMDHVVDMDHASIGLEELCRYLEADCIQGANVQVNGRQAICLYNLIRNAVKYQDAFNKSSDRPQRVRVTVDKENGSVTVSNQSQHDLPDQPLVPGITAHNDQSNTGYGLFLADLFSSFDGLNLRYFSTPFMDDRQRALGYEVKFTLENFPKSRLK